MQQFTGFFPVVVISCIQDLLSTLCNGWGACCWRLKERHCVGVEDGEFALVEQCEAMCDEGLVVAGLGF